VINFYSKTNEMHQFLKFILFYFVVSLYVFRTVLSIIKSNKVIINKFENCAYSWFHYRNRNCISFCLESNSIKMLMEDTVFSFIN